MIEGRTKDWFVANVRELRWQENELGATCEFDKHASGSTSSAST